MNTTRILSAAFAILAASAAGADDWPQWRGPNRNGISSESVRGELAVRWKADVGLGFSSSTVAKGRLVTLGNADDTDTVFCFDAEKGDVLWKHSYPADKGALYFDG